MHSSPVVTLDGVEIAFAGSPVLKDVALELHPSTSTALVGRSGSGKTSLLLVMAGLVRPAAGHVAWPALETDPTTRQRQIALVFQAPALIAELTAVENVCLPLRLAGRNEREAGEASRRSLAAVDLEQRLWTALPAHLSGGEQQRVEVARALAGEPRMVLADEPTGALDRAHADAVLESLQAVARRSGAALLVATHDAQIASRFERLISIDDGTTQMWTT